MKRVKPNQTRPNQREGLGNDILDKDGAIMLFNGIIRNGVMNNLFVIPATLIILITGISRPSGAQQSEIESEILSLDPEIRQGLVYDMVDTLDKEKQKTSSPGTTIESGAISTSPEGVPEEISTWDHQAEQDVSVEMIETTGEAKPQESSGRVQAKRKNYIRTVKGNKKDYLRITLKRKDRLLVTVGDVIYMPTPASRSLHPNERYFVYKFVKKIEARPQPFEVFEQVGKIKILEITSKLTIARVIAARDIIKNGDVVFLNNPSD